MVTDVLPSKRGKDDRGRPRLASPASQLEEVTEKRETAAPPPPRSARIAIADRSGLTATTARRARVHV